ncbi:MAG: hypothetical protein WC291_11610 [Thermodesulfovibrionales bacterium]|jgi:hypothetical protein
MQASEPNPFGDHPVMMVLKTPVVWEGKLKPAGAWLQGVKISAWLSHGIMIGGETFVPWANIVTITKQIEGF